MADDDIENQPNRNQVNPDNPDNVDNVDNPDGGPAANRVANGEVPLDLLQR